MVASGPREVGLRVHNHEVHGPDVEGVPHGSPVLGTTLERGHPKPGIVSAEPLQRLRVESGERERGIGEEEKDWSRVSSLLVEHGGRGRGRGCTHVMHGRSCMTTDPRIPTMSGRDGEPRVEAEEPGITCSKKREAKREVFGKSQGGRATSHYVITTFDADNLA